MNDPELFDRVDERHALDELLKQIEQGASGSLALYGEAGMGKTFLLEYAASHARVPVVHLLGVEAEQSFGFAALHRLLTPFMEHIPLLPSGQQAALGAAFGLTEHLPPDRYMVGLAALGVLALEGAHSGLLCIVDDAQWIDRDSLQALAFVGRRLNAEGVGLLFGTRTRWGLPPDLAGIAGLEIAGLPSDAAADLLYHTAQRPLARGVVERILDETNGCPLALQELGTELAQRSAAQTEPGATINIGRRVEEHFLRQVSSLPHETQLYLLVAAADSSGLRPIVEAAAALLGCSVNADDAAIRERVLAPEQRIRFRHPLIRSAILSGADPEQLRLVHRTLASVIGSTQPDRWARHVVLGADGPNEQLALQLEATAEMARARGGYSAEMVMLKGAADLSESIDLRSARFLRASKAAVNAGANEQAGELLDNAEANLSDPIAIGEALQLRGQLTVLQYQPAQAPARLLAAARQFRPLSTARCREALLEAFGAYVISQHFTADISASEISQLELEVESELDDNTLESHLLSGTARLLESGPVAAYPYLRDATEILREGDLSGKQISSLTFGFILANELLDEWTHQVWADRVDRHARETGALPLLLFNLFGQAESHLRLGNLPAAMACYEEALDVASAVGMSPEYYKAMNVTILAWSGDEAGTCAAAESLTNLATAVGVAATVAMVHQALAILNIGYCRYSEALRATDYLCRHNVLGWTTDILPLTVEAALGSGERDKAQALGEELAVRAEAIGSNWAMGLFDRAQALLSETDQAEQYFESSIAHLERTSVRTALAHSQLLYGEWLQRRNRRVEARSQLQRAYDFFASMGAEHFAKRAAIALAATGQHVGERSPRKALELTPKELRVAQLASERFTNAEIAAQLFISSATVDYHLRKVFRKLGIESRRQLRDALVET